jgi:3,4-dihydroxy-2-butanone 4-phosphate synthase
MSIQVGWMPSVIDDLHAGKIIVLVGDEDRENKGDLV